VATARSGDEVQITSRKVAGLDPRWRPLAGMSLLYDPVPAPGAFWDRLARLVDVFGRSRLRDEFSFCPLPRPTFHVTLCDGVHEGELWRLLPSARDEVAAFLAGIARRPAAPPEPPPSLGFFYAPDLPEQAARAPVAFAAHSLARTGHALVVRLEPRDAVSAERLDVVRQARARVAEQARAIGLDRSVWIPHVTLGYFANRDLAARADAQVDAWWEQASRELGDVAVELGPASIYCFTDMVSFFRRVGPGASP
jgi:hypothetical protein